MWVDDLKLYDIPTDFLGTREDKERRKEICSGCSNLTKINTCSLCNCVMPAKWWLKHASCPLEKW